MFLITAGAASPVLAKEPAAAEKAAKTESTGKAKASGQAAKKAPDHRKMTPAEARKAARKAIEEKVRARGAAKADIERQKIFQDAVTALRETQNAIVALDKKDKEKALAALEKAIGKLELVLARDPNLALAPVDVTTQTLDIYADVKSVKKAVDEAIDLLRKGRVQDARALVSGLASEIVIEVINIPLATYPDAIKAVVPLIEQGKFKEAKEALVAALNTLVITRHIIPLPILRVEQMLVRAEQLAEKAKRTEAEEKELKAILKAARTELEFAEALGYGKEEDFKTFYEELDKIASKTSGGGHGKGFFDRLKKALADFRARLF
jgi:hypothetical protein